MESICLGLTRAQMAGKKRLDVQLEKGCYNLRSCVDTLKLAILL